jgi:hypothetical protein
VLATLRARTSQNRRRSDTRHRLPGHLSSCTRRGLALMRCTYQQGRVHPRTRSGRGVQMLERQLGHDQSAPQETESRCPPDSLEAQGCETPLSASLSRVGGSRVARKREGRAYATVQAAAGGDAALSSTMRRNSSRVNVFRSWFSTVGVE